MIWYLGTLIKVVTKPLHFFGEMPQGTWQEDPLSFALVTGWIFSFAVTMVIFINNYLPTGLSLIDGIYGKKLIIAVPVLMVMGLAFFLMTLLIIAGILILAFLGLFFVCGAVLDFLLVLLGGKGNIFETVKATLYCSAAVLAGLINILLMIPVKYKIMTVHSWITLEKIVYYAASIFLFYLFIILGQKTHNLPRWKAFLAATIPFIILVLFNVVLSAKVLPKVAGMLG